MNTKTSLWMLKLRYSNCFIPSRHNLKIPQYHYKYSVTIKKWCLLSSCVCFLKCALCFTMTQYAVLSCLWHLNFMKRKRITFPFWIHLGRICCLLVLLESNLSVRVFLLNQSVCFRALVKGNTVGSYEKQAGVAKEDGSVLRVKWSEWLIQLKDHLTVTGLSTDLYTLVMQQV